MHWQRTGTSAGASIDDLTHPQEYQVKAQHSLYLCAAMLSGCATTTNFSKALEEPVKTANSARTVVLQAQRDAEKARIVDWIQHPPVPAQDWVETVCTPSKSMIIVLHELGAFGDALELIKDVAEKPDGTSYAVYLAQFRKNKARLQAARAMADPAAMAAEAQQLKEQTAAAHDRCVALYRADAASDSTLTQVGGESFATLNAISTLINALLALAENAQREQAVRTTAKSLIPGLTLALQHLSAKPLVESPRIAYAERSSRAATMGETRLGNVVNIRRWFVARQIEQSRKRLRCTTLDACLGDPAMRATLDSIVTDITDYRQLATIDTDKTLETLDKGIKAADKAANDPAGNWAQMLDALVATADAIGDLNSKYGAVKASRD